MQEKFLVFEFAFSTIVGQILAALAGEIYINAPGENLNLVAQLHNYTCARAFKMYSFFSIVDN